MCLWVHVKEKGRWRFHNLAEILKIAIFVKKMNNHVVGIAK